MNALARELHRPPARLDRIELIAGIWQRLLRCPDVTPDSNFFDLGGDSLLAIALFLEIEKATGCRLPITMIYDAQTISDQAALLQGEPAPEFSPLVLLKPGDEGPPLFIFHGVGGTVVEFAGLGKLIGINGEVYAVQAQGIDGTCAPLTRVEAMAQLYCDAIRKKQPTGPYWLCGYSFGGLLAMEVARLLKAAGEEIALLFMIDAYAHPITWPKKSRAKVKIRRAFRSLLAALRHPMTTTAALFWATKQSFAKRASAEVAGDPRARKRQWLVNRNPNLPAPLLKTRLAADEALFHYQPRHYPGPVIFLKARRPDPDFPDDPRHVWRRLVEGLTLHVSPGSHMTIINEHAPDVAACINRCIREALTRRR